jgi:hypothetical protein
LGTDICRNLSGANTLVQFSERLLSFGGTVSRAEFGADLRWKWSEGGNQQRKGTDSEDFPSEKRGAVFSGK